jgi:hypothetical protein
MYYLHTVTGILSANNSTSKVPMVVSIVANFDIVNDEFFERTQKYNAKVKRCGAGLQPGPVFVRGTSAPHMFFTRYMRLFVYFLYIKRLLFKRIF